MIWVIKSGELSGATVPRLRGVSPMTATHSTKPLFTTCLWAYTYIYEYMGLCLYINISAMNIEFISHNQTSRINNSLCSSITLFLFIAYPSPHPHQGCSSNDTTNHSRESKRVVLETAELKSYSTSLIPIKTLASSQLQSKAGGGIKIDCLLYSFFTNSCHLAS